MAKSKSPHQRVPDFTGWGGVRGLRARIADNGIIQKNRDAIAREILVLAGSRLTDIVTWGPDGVNLKPSDEISDEAVRCIKKVKITKNTDPETGKTTETTEVELYDKVAALRLLAKAAGFLDGSQNEINRPTVVGINIKSPNAPAEIEPVTPYQVVEDDGNTDPTG